MFQILTNPVDPETEIIQDELIERLYIEGHLVTITTEIVTPQLLALEEQKRIREQARAEAAAEAAAAALELSVPKVNAKEETSTLLPITEKVVPLEKEARQQPFITKYVKSRRRVSSLISVRLKSGELLKTSRELIEQLRAKAKQDDNDLVVMKLQSKPPVIHIPFTDRLGNAVKRIQPLPSTVESPKKEIPLNGRIHKILKIRGALDKSTIALASTVRVKPKTNLLQQLESVSRLSPPQPSQPVKYEKTIPTVAKNRHHSAHGQLVPVLMKWKNSSNHTKMLPLSTALQRIQTDTMHSDSTTPLTNGHKHSNGVS